MAFAAYRPDEGDWLGNTAGGIPAGYVRTVQIKRDGYKQENVLTWDSLDDAIVAAEKADAYWRNEFTVIHVSVEGPGYADPGRPLYSSRRDTRQGTTEAVSHVSGKDTDVAAQPLNVTRTKLMKALQDAQKRIQQDADEARAAALNEFNELTALLASEAGASALRAVITHAIGFTYREGGQLKLHNSQKHTAVVKDETIEKQLRLLALSEDKTIEVTPTDDFYRYL